MNNSYQVNAVTPLAIRYNDQSVLENFHCSCTFDILAVPECNILSHLDDDARLRFRQIVIQLILATDVTRHRHAIDELPQAGQSLDWKSPQDRLSVLKNIMCMSDLNNETRSFDLSLKWGPLVQEEFYRQGDIEKAEGLPVKPMMERSARVEVEQQGFIKYLCLPLYEANAQLFPGVDVCVQNLRGNLASWEERAAES
ncbi:putative 3prime [Diplonema papillatum]|nr:putative 3prime [Diplonema papillatum]